MVENPYHPPDEISTSSDVDDSTDDVRVESTRTWILPMGFGGAAVGLAIGIMLLSQFALLRGYQDKVLGFCIVAGSIASLWLASSIFEPTRRS